MVDPFSALQENFLCCETYECDSISEVECRINKINGFNVHTQNVRSLKNNFDSLYSYLKAVKVHFHLIVLTETWNYDQLSFPFPGYKEFRNLDNANKAEGVSMYLRDDVKIETIETDILVGCNSMFAMVIFDHATIAITGIYRSPDRDVHVFLPGLESYVSKLENYKYHILCGDINIDIAGEKNSASMDYLNILSGFGLNSYVNKYTRIRNKSKSCLDHVFLKDSSIESDRKIGLIYNGEISDHFMSMASVKLSREPGKFDKGIANNMAKESVVYVEQDVDVALQSFFKIRRAVFTKFSVI